MFSMTARAIDIRGSDRYLFFTSSSGVSRTNKGRQALTRRIVAHSSTKYNSGISSTTDSTRSENGLLTQTSSTQTDQRDSEIQTDPWWQQAEGSFMAGLTQLCCRGSHRKLDKAKWIARHRAAADVMDGKQSPSFYVNNSEISRTSDYNTYLKDVNYQNAFPLCTEPSTDGKKRSVGSGPTCDPRRFLPDPVDLWVSTYQKLRQDNHVFEEKIAIKRDRLLCRQREKLRRTEGHAALCARTRYSLPRSTVPSHYSSASCKISSVLESSIAQMSSELPSQVINSLCQMMDSQHILK